MNLAQLTALCLLGGVVLGWSQAAQVQPRPGSLPSASGLPALLEAYSELTGKTVLRANPLPKVDDLGPQSLPAQTNLAVAAIESRLREIGIDLVQQSPWFVCAVPAGWSNSPAAAFLRNVEPPSDHPETSRMMVNFAAADLEQVLSIYAKLRSRTILKSKALGARALVMRNPRDLTSDELAYGITVLLALNGMAAVDDGDKFVQVVRMENWKGVVTASPKPSQDAPVLDPSELPKFKLERPPSALDRLNRLYLQIFDRQSPWMPRPADKLARYYAELTDQQAVPSANHGQMEVLFEVTTPLTREEILYAIETTFRLDGLAISHVGTKQVTVISLAEHQRRKADEAAKPQRP